MLGVFGVILTGLPDILDGSVARQSGRAGPRGAFFDSVCDRVADAALFIGVAWYLAETGTRACRCWRWRCSRSRCSSPTSGPGPSRSGFQARGGLMERAERLVLLGVGLAFDILVPVLWVMLVLTAFTAVQRFVKVWRQATPERPRRTRHHRGSGTEEPRAGSLAQWWAAHRPQTRALRRVALRVASSLTAPRAARCSILPARTPYLAYRAGAGGRARRSRRSIGAPLARGVAQLAPAVMRERRAPGRAQPAAGPRAGASAAPRCAAPSPRRSTRTGATSTSCSGSRRTSRRVDPRALPRAPASSTSRAGVDDGQGRGARAAAPRQLGLRRRVARAARATR